MAVLTKSKEAWEFKNTNKMKPEQSVYNKLHKFSAKEEPMKVEFAAIDATINDIKNHNLNSTLNLVGDAIKILEKASGNARTAERSAEMRLNNLETLIKKGQELGFDVSDYTSFLSMAKAHLQKAGDVAKRIEKASASARLAYD
jgi:hypothetical protein